MMFYNTPEEIDALIESVSHNQKENGLWRVEDFITKF